MCSGGVNPKMAQLGKATQFRRVSESQKGFGNFYISSFSVKRNGTFTDFHVTYDFYYWFTISLLFGGLPLTDNNLSISHPVLQAWVRRSPGSTASAGGRRDWLRESDEKGVKSFKQCEILIKLSVKFLQWNMFRLCLKWIFGYFWNTSGVFIILQIGFQVRRSFTTRTVQEDCF